MSRTKRFRYASVVVALAVATAATLALAPAIAQSEDEEPVPAEAGTEEAMEFIALSRSDTFVSGPWEISVGEVFVAPSPIRHGYDEVRVAITMLTADFEVLYRWDGFVSDELYPRLSIIDSSGIERPLNGARNTSATLPGSMLTTIPPGMTGRWTAGFQVPSEYSDAMSLVVHSSWDAGSASFDLSSAMGGPLAGQPDGTFPVAMGETFDWGASFSMTPFNHGALVCGDPSSQLAVQILAVAFEVSNTTVFDADWPTRRFPDQVAVAQWPDGATARFVFETYAGDFDPLLKWADDAVRLPPSFDGAAAVTYDRAMLFAVPRDGRLGTVADAPLGLWMQPPDGAGPVWLDLSSPGTLSLDPTLCDEGNFDFPIPLAFAPGADFLVGTAPTSADPAQQDLTARQLLSEALVVAGNFRAANDGVYDGMTAGSLAALWNGISYNTGFEATVGTVGVTTAANESGEVFGILVTESASGTFFCLSDSSTGLVQESAATIEDASTACVPVPAEAPAEEEEEEG